MVEKGGGGCKIGTDLEHPLVFVISITFWPPDTFRKVYISKWITSVVGFLHLWNERS